MLFWVLFGLFMSWFGFFFFGFRWPPVCFVVISSCDLLLLSTSCSPVFLCSPPPCLSHISLISTANCSQCLATSTSPLGSLSLYLCLCCSLTICWFACLRPRIPCAPLPVPQSFCVPCIPDLFPVVFSYVFSFCITLVFPFSCFFAASFCLLPFSCLHICILDFCIFFCIGFLLKLWLFP